jgi:hypothetical protein
MGASDLAGHTPDITNAACPALGQCAGSHKLGQPEWVQGILQGALLCLCHLCRSVGYKDMHELRTEPKQLRKRCEARLCHCALLCAERDLRAAARSVVQRV